ncbi:hypothetical protein B1C78_13105 [Thioalkalivibrio denitrificans]|uniref:Uncharacterized protein n=1 Tax=Thioalkalivibrio denitrificans TaxID=108003 RepID=A0A1V3NDN3_9GAMM|nr:hypothetical protein [Thioalkalivibrio denitrificans]OOG22988.1 hypothetical protein B1C78_13105 [Thioalkalivibrio denitrificans]
MRIIAIIAMLVFVAGSAVAAERKPIEEVDADALASDTQATPAGAGDKHASLTWWIPHEFWQSVLARDPSVSAADKKAILDALEPVSLLAVVQADISPLGAFHFYGKDEVQSTMVVTFDDANSRSQRLSPMQSVGADLAVLLEVLKPLLGAALGNMGANMHFYVFDDRAPGAGRQLDPYEPVRLSIQLRKRNGDLMTARVELPINALFVPRLCSDGREAHVTWNYCPWTGERL